MESAVECVYKTFFLYEPLTPHLQTGEEGFRLFVNQMLTHALKDELSWLASHPKTGQVVGAFIATDLGDDFKPSVTDPGLIKMLKLTEDLWAPFAYEMNVKKRNTEHSQMGAVLPEYQRLGIMNQLNRMVNDHAFEKGYKKMMGEATSQYSLNMRRKNPGIKELHTIVYDDYEQDGKRILSGIKTHKQCVLFSVPIELWG